MATSKKINVKKKTKPKKRAKSRKKKVSIFKRMQKWSKEKKIAASLFLVMVLVVIASALLNIDVEGILLLKPTPTAVTIGNNNHPEGIHVIDVGQGTAVLVEDNGHFALMDAGTKEKSDELVDYLKNAGVIKLDYIFMTHPHADHIGGMEEVLKNFEVGQLVLYNTSLAPYPTTATFLSLIEYALETNVYTTEVNENLKYELGNGEIAVVHGGLETTDNFNLVSSGLLYSGNDISMLYTGDAEKANEKAMVESNKNLNATVFIAGHHGSNTSNTADYLNEINPAYCVISCGEQNKYGHPHRSVLENFEQAGAVILRTDETGHILLKPAV